MVTAIGGLEDSTKVLLQVVMEEVPRSRCANLIILIFLNGEKTRTITMFWGCCLQLLKNKLTRLLNFITKSTVTTYLSTYLYILNHFGWNGDWQ